MRLKSLLPFALIVAVSSLAGASTSSDRTERVLFELPGIKVVSVAMTGEDGPRAAVNFYSGEKRVQILAKRQLPSLEVANQIAAAAAFKLCASNGARHVFNAQLANLTSLFYVVDAKRGWGEFPKTVTTCPSLSQDPPHWNPDLKKAP